MNGLRKTLRHLFIPQEQNQYKARLLHIDMLSGYLIFMLVILCSVKFLNSSNVLGYATDITVDKLYQLTNTQRLEHGLPTLTYNQELAQAAQNKANDMFAKNYWAHFGPDGETPWQFILGAGYKYEYAGENLAKNFMFSQAVIDAWMNSPTHRENMLRKEYQDVGFAIVNGVLNGEQTTLVVQMFGTPQGTSIPVVTQQTSQSAPAQAQTTQQSVKQIAQPQKNMNPIVEGALVQQEKSQPFITLPALGNIELIFILFIGLALVFDFVCAARLKIVHTGGKHIAHIIFICVIAIGFVIVLRGGGIQ